MFAVFPLETRGNAAYDMKDRPDAGRGRGPDGIVGVQTKRAIRVSRSVCVCVGKLD